MLEMKYGQIGVALLAWIGYFGEFPLSMLKEFGGTAEGSIDDYGKPAAGLRLQPSRKIKVVKYNM